MDRRKLEIWERSHNFSERYVRNDFRRDPNAESSSKNLKEESQLLDPIDNSTQMDSKAKRTSEESKENSKSDSDSSDRKNAEQRNSQELDNNMEDTDKLSKFL